MHMPHHFAAPGKQYPDQIRETLARIQDGASSDPRSALFSADSFEAPLNCIDIIASGNRRAFPELVRVMKDFPTMFDFANYGAPKFLGHSIIDLPCSPPMMPVEMQIIARLDALHGVARQTIALGQETEELATMELATAWLTSSSTFLSAAEREVDVPLPEIPAELAAFQFEQCCAALHVPNVLNVVMHQLHVITKANVIVIGLHDPEGKAVRALHTFHHPRLAFVRAVKAPRDDHFGRETWAVELP